MAMERRHVEVLNSCDYDLMTTLSLPFLLPHLQECKLLAEKVVASLSKPDLNPPEVTRHFLNILKSKGSRAFSLFLNALKKEDEHIGHRDLYELLYQENQCTPDRPDNCLQESNESESYPTALVVPNTGNSLEIEVAKPWVSTDMQSQKSSAQWRIQDGAFGANAPFKKLHTRSRYSNRAVNYSNKAVTMLMRQCSLPMKLYIGFYFT